MEQINLKNKRVIDVFNDSDIIFWTRKLNITHQQLSDAILNTGSVCISDIKKYLGMDKSVFFLSDLFGKKKDKKIAC